MKKKNFKKSLINLLESYAESPALQWPQIAGQPIHGKYTPSRGPPESLMTDQWKILHYHPY